MVRLAHLAKVPSGQVAAPVQQNCQQLPQRYAACRIGQQRQQQRHVRRACGHLVLPTKPTTLNSGCAATVCEPNKVCCLSRQLMQGLRWSRDNR
jgi:hypothetical protein